MARLRTYNKRAKRKLPYHRCGYKMGAWSKYKYHAGRRARQARWEAAEAKG